MSRLVAPHISLMPKKERNESMNPLHLLLVRCISSSADKEVHTAKADREKIPQRQAGRCLTCTTSSSTRRFPRRVGAADMVSRIAAPPTRPPSATLLLRCLLVGRWGGTTRAGQEVPPPRPLRSYSLAFDSLLILKGWAASTQCEERGGTLDSALCDNIFFIF